MRYIIMSAIVVYPLLGAIWASPTIADTDSSLPVIRVQKLGLAPSRIKEKFGQTGSDSTYFHESRLDASDGRSWDYELYYDHDLIDGTLIIDSDSGLVGMEYTFEFDNPLTCRSVLNRILLSDGADTLPTRNKLFDVCENVRSVESDEIELRWKSESLGQQLDLGVYRDNKQVTVSYKLPLFGY